MKLQILIPQWNETDTDIKPLLDSLAIQQNVNFNEISVIICNDGSDTFLTNELLVAYPFTIEYYKLPHGGVSATRNACLKYATADYVMFCDADDMFFSACGLYVVFREFINGFDVLVSNFVEETINPETNEPTYINHENDFVFVHGKVFRREYLIDNAIYWNETLTVHEDSYFNALAQRCTTQGIYCPTAFYLWKWRDNSVCRHDDKYILKTYGDMLNSNSALVREFLRRNKTEDAHFFCSMMVYDAYLTLNKDEWRSQENVEYREAVEYRFAEYWNEFSDLFNTTDISIRARIIAGLKNRFFVEGLLLESITFDDWIEKIMKNRFDFV